MSLAQSTKNQDGRQHFPQIFVIRRKSHFSPDAVTMGATWQGGQEKFCAVAAYSIPSLLPAGQNKQVTNTAEEKAVLVF